MSGSRRARWLLATLLLGPVAATAVRGDDGAAARPAGRQAGQAANRPTPPFTAERESAALAFVGQHYPELAGLLARLAPMNRPEYEKAIVELSVVSENLEALKRRDPRRHELALAAWKARSRAELLGAQLAGRSAPSPALEARLRAAIREQVELEVRRHRLDREQALARAKRAQDAIERLDRDRDELIRQRFQRLLREGRAAQRRDRPAGARAPADAARTGRPREDDPR